jgi:hypothetical protein
MGASKMGAGANQMWQGAEGVASTALDYAGTKYLGGIYDTQSQSVDQGPGSYFGSPIAEDMNNLGSEQVAPATNLGSDPYSNDNFQPPKIK